MNGEVVGGRAHADAVAMVKSATAVGQWAASALRLSFVVESNPAGSGDGAEARAQESGPRSLWETLRLSVVGQRGHTSPGEAARP